ncbi:MAG: hypothetical protein DWB44_10815 [Chloroflexi bacterium]|nr:hypothetical protein [Chloroflexota bacterium]GIK27779.1 MAG: 3'(2'),5'-bisphosphate nucleotidase [Chloroflexota bacterium]
MNLEPIKTAARQAAALCSTVQKRHFVTSQKADNDGPVTIADYGAQALIANAIKLHFPGDAVLAEESGEQFVGLVPPEQRAKVVALIGEVLGHRVSESDVVSWLDYGKDIQADRTWVIDPIDGTKGFIAMRHYAIAIGVLRGGQAVGGVMACPGYPAYNGGGALLWTENDTCMIGPISGFSGRQVRVSAIQDVQRVRVLESVEKSHAGFERMLRARMLAGLDAAPVERLDSMEKYARIAAGDAELYLRLPNLKSTRAHSTWDHAAGAALVRAAGGLATDIDGSPLDFSSGRTMARTRGMIVSNGRIHAQMIEGVRALLEEEAGTAS